MSETNYIHHLPGLIKGDALFALNSLLERAPFTDGRSTASDAAREVKKICRLT